MSKPNLEESPTATLTPKERVELMSELAAPYRQLRKFIYLAAGASAGIGAFVFFFRVLAGRDLSVSLPTLALQLGILAGVIGLLKLENRANQRLKQRLQQRLSSQKQQTTAEGNSG